MRAGGEPSVDTLLPIMPSNLAGFPKPRTNKTKPTPREGNSFPKVKTAVQLLRLIKQIRNHKTPMNRKSWITSLFGAGGLLALWSPVLAAALDGDPSTVPTYGAAITGSLTAIGLLFAADAGATKK